MLLRTPTITYIFIYTYIQTIKPYKYLNIDLTMRSYRIICTDVGGYCEKLPLFKG